MNEKAMFLKCRALREMIEIPDYVEVHHYVKISSVTDRKQSKLSENSKNSTSN